MTRHYLWQTGIMARVPISSVMTHLVLTEFGCNHTPTWAEKKKYELTEKFIRNRIKKNRTIKWLITIPASIIIFCVCVTPLVVLSFYCREAMYLSVPMGLFIALLCILFKDKLDSILPTDDFWVRIKYKHR